MSPVVLFVVVVVVFHPEHHEIAQSSSHRECRAEVGGAVGGMRWGCWPGAVIEAPPIESSGNLLRECTVSVRWRLQGGGQRKPEKGRVASEGHRASELERR